MVVEVGEEEKDDGAITERGSNIVSNLLELSGAKGDATKNY